jgi:hypothetical protein
MATPTAAIYQNRTPVLLASKGTLVTSVAVVVGPTLPARNFGSDRFCVTYLVVGPLVNPINGVAVVGTGSVVFTAGFVAAGTGVLAARTIAAAAFGSQTLLVPLETGDTVQLSGTALRLDVTTAATATAGSVMDVQLWGFPL